MVKVKGSKEGSILSACFNGKSKSLFPTLKNTKSLVLLSITGNPYCQKEYLKAIINKACSSHEFTTFLIADEVHWHNLQENVDNDESSKLKQQAQEMGMVYLDNNLECFLDVLNITSNEFDEINQIKNSKEKLLSLNNIARQKSNFEVVTWSGWLSKSVKFNDIKNDMESLFDCDETLKKSLDSTAENFALRHQDNKNLFKLLYQRSKGYLIEESCAVMWIAISLGYNFITYPGDFIKPFRAIKEYLLDNLNSNYYIETKNPQLLANWLNVSFKRSHASKSLNVTATPKADDNLSSLIKGITEGIFVSVTNWLVRPNLNRRQLLA